MKKKYVSVVLPVNKDFIMKTKAFEVPIHEKTIYDALGYFEDEIDKEITIEYFFEEINNYFDLREIINLHDEEGLKLKRIIKMSSSINSGNHIIAKPGLPNIKLIKTSDNKVLVFDGHHTIISYLLEGKKYLSEIPHILFESEIGYFKDDDISVFFLRHKNKIKKDNWRKYVANWNLPFSKQITLRKRQNIGELYDAIKPLIIS